MSGDLQFFICRNHEHFGLCRWRRNDSLLAADIVGFLIQLYAKMFQIRAADQLTDNRAVFADSRCKADRIRTI